MVVEACLPNLERVRGAVRRDLMFYALARLQHGFQEFLQGLFIRHRVYPIAYNKWIREQVGGVARAAGFCSRGFHRSWRSRDLMGPRCSPRPPLSHHPCRQVAGVSASGAHERAGWCWVSLESGFLSTGA